MMTLLCAFSENYVFGNWYIDEPELEDWFGPDFVFGRSDLLVAMPNSFWTSLASYLMTTRIVNGRASHAVYRVNKVDGAFLDCSKVYGSDIPRVIRSRKKYVTRCLTRMIASDPERTTQPAV